LIWVNKDVDAVQHRAAAGAADQADSAARNASMIAASLTG
jgi:hypothetical protein